VGGIEPEGQETGQIGPPELREDGIRGAYQQGQGTVAVVAAEHRKAADGEAECQRQGRRPVRGARPARGRATWFDLVHATGIESTDEPGIERRRPETPRHRLGLASASSHLV